MSAMKCPDCEAGEGGGEGGVRSLQCDGLVLFFTSNSPQMRIGHNLYYKIGTRTITGPSLTFYSFVMEAEGRC